MRRSLLRKAMELIQRNKYNRYWQRTVRAMAVVVVFCTTYALILPAITMTQPPICGQEAHQHLDGCYTRQEVLQFTCSFEAGAAVSHTHDGLCLDAQGSLICNLPELEAHAHEATCRTVQSVLVCSLEETEEHTHETACYETKETLVCQKQETLSHAHTEECRVAGEPKLVLTCQLAEHTHEAACYPEEKNSEGLTYLCSSGAHTHGENCRDEAGSLACNIPEHIHEAACLVADLDLTADVETPAQWADSIASVVLTGNWREDTLAIAESQLHYRESSRNVALVNDQLKGYTRYGDWYGIPYGDWDAMFASFCLSHAQVKDFPLDSNAQSWKLKLEEAELYQLPEAYTPNPGDLIFLDRNQAADAPVEIPVNADRVGIVAELLPANEEHPAQYKVILGDCDNQVAYATYLQDDCTIVGFGAVPEKAPEEDISQDENSSQEQETLSPEPAYLCGQEAHTHETACVNEAGEQVCGKNEHTHSESCNEKTEELPSEPVYLCGQEAHTHEAACVNEAGEQVCGKNEHTHSESCNEKPEELPSEPVYLCGQEAHTHEAACMNEAGAQVCGKNEHTHSESCNEKPEELPSEPVYLCGQEAHAHEATCVNEAGEQVCGKNEHTHSESCNEKQEALPVAPAYVCGQEAHTHDTTCLNAVAELTCTRKEHVHSDACVAKQEEPSAEEGTKEYFCGLAEHTHGDACRDENGILVCTQEAHIHSDACAQEKEITYFCGISEHTHAELCRNESGELLCTLQEHTHTEACTLEKEPALLCGLEEHVHGDACRNEEGETLCAIPEHTHQPVCQVEELDLNADVETRTQWEATLSEVTVTGNWPMDTLAIAISQLNYQESTKNVILRDGMQQGYTRYGAWAEDAYGDWNTKFAAFCLHYAQGADSDQTSYGEDWILGLPESSQYRTPDTYAPKPGDLIFFRENQVGIVRRILAATEETPAQVKFIAGDQEGRVSYVTMDLQDPAIGGYGLLPEGPAVCCCGQEAHAHCPACYGETGELICGLPEHTHDVNCLGRKLTYSDDTVQVEMILTDSILLPQDLELKVRLVSREEADPSYEAMSDAVRESMMHISPKVEDIAFFQMELLSQGKLYHLPDGAEAQVQVTFASPMFAPEAVTDSTILRTFAVDAVAEAEPEAAAFSGLRAAAPEQASFGMRLLGNLSSLDSTAGETLNSQTGYQTQQAETDSYDNMAEGVTGLRFSTSSISTFAVALADTYVEDNVWELVTSTDQLNSDDVYMIIAAEGTHALVNDTSTNYLQVNVEMVSGHPGNYTITQDNGDSVSNASAQWKFTASGSNWKIYNQASDPARYLVLDSDTIFNRNSRDLSLAYQNRESSWVISNADNTRYKLAIRASGAFYRSDTRDSIISNPDSSPYQRLVMIFRRTDKTLEIPEDVISSGGSSSSGAVGEKPTKPQYAGPLKVSEGLTGETSHKAVEGTYYSDPATSQLESLFTGITDHDGRILTDKSVIYGADDYKAFERYDANTFGVTLSALGQEYTFLESQTIKTPLDVVFILDVSGSMRETVGSERRIDAMVNAVNSAMTTILTDADNRVGVVLYSSGAWKMLELGRYVQNNNQYLKTSLITSGWKANYSSAPRYQVSGNTGLAVANTDYGGSINSNILNADQANGTYTQAGIALGAQMLQNADQKTFTNALSDGRSITVNRQPVMILLSDGEPTHCTSNYKDVLKGPHYGDGLVDANYQGVYGYYTILSANYYKRQVGNAYKNPAMFYTVGMGIAQTGDVDSSGSNYDSDVYKRAVLNPTVSNITNLASSIRPTNTVDQLKSLMLNTFGGKTINVSVAGQGYMTDWMGQVHRAVPVLSNPYSSNYSYADKAYFGQIGSDELQKIFSEIINDSMSFTSSDFVLQGSSAVELMDPIGEGMEIKGDPVLRYGGVNHAHKEKIQSGNKVTYQYDVDYQATDGSRFTADLSTIVVEVITDENGLQTVHMDVPDMALPVLIPRYYKNAAGQEELVFYYEALPVRLIYQVGLTAEAQQKVEALKTTGGTATYYTNRYQGETAHAYMNHTEGNPYYALNGPHDQNHSVAKSENVTGTAANSFACDHGRKEENGTEVPWITQALGNNGKLVFKAYVRIPVEKYWQEGVDPMMQEPVAIQLYRVKDNVAEHVKTLMLNTTNEWKGVFEDLPILEEGFYAIAETIPSGFMPTYSAQTVTVTLSGKPIQVVPVKSDTAEEVPAVTVTNYEAYELPQTGSIGTHYHTYGGLLLMAAAALAYGKKRRKGGKQR